jgi:hypothetical protein
MIYNILAIFVFINLTGQYDVVWNEEALQSVHRTNLIHFIWRNANPFIYFIKLVGIMFDNSATFEGLNLSRVYHQNTLCFLNIIGFFISHNSRKFTPHSINLQQRRCFWMRYPTNSCKGLDSATLACYSISSLNKFWIHLLWNQFHQKINYTRRRGTLTTIIGLYIYQGLYKLNTISVDKLFSNTYDPPIFSATTVCQEIVSHLSEQICVLMTQVQGTIDGNKTVLAL